MCARREKTCPGGFAYNKGTDQPAHSCSLITAVVIRLLESKHATSEILMFLLLSVAEQVGLKLT